MRVHFLKILRILLCFIIVWTLVLNWQGNAWMNHISTINANWELIAIVIGSLFFLLNGVAIIGLARNSGWGYWVSYIAIAFASYFLQSSYLAFGALKQIPFWGANLIIFALIVFCHWRMQISKR